MVKNSMMPLTRGKRGKQYRQLGAVIVFFSLFALIQINTGCSQYDSGVGGETISTPDLGEMKETIIPVNATANMTAGDRYKTSTSLLVLGIQDDITSEMFFQFTDFSSLGDTVLNINSGELRLYASGFIDSAAAADGTPWTATVKRIDEPFELIDMKYDLELLTTDIGTFEFGTTDTTDSISFTIDNETLARWFQDTLAYGIKIVPDDGANFLKRFYPQNSTTDASVQPKLIVNVDYQVDEEVFEDITDTLYAAHNTYLVNDDLPFEDDLLQMSSGFAKRMLFSGDFTELRSDLVSLNRAELVLHYDDTWDHEIGTSSFFTWWDLRSEWVESGEIDSVEFGNMSSLAYAVRTDTNTVRLNITPIVKWWVMQPDSNFGLSVRYISEGTGISRLAFHDYDETNPVDTFEEATTTDQPYFYLIFTEFIEP